MGLYLPRPSEKKQRRNSDLIISKSSSPRSLIGFSSFTTRIGKNKVYQHLYLSITISIIDTWSFLLQVSDDNVEYCKRFPSFDDALEKEEMLD